MGAGVAFLWVRMMEEVHWHIERIDENDEIAAADGECLFEIEGAIQCDGEPAGEVGATYVYLEEPAAEDTFLWMWDLTSTACDLYETIISPDGGSVFRDPLPDFLGYATGILCVHYIALTPEFRRRGIGREVMRETVRQFADPRVGVVLIDTLPLQHRPGAYDHFFDEVRDLPFEVPEEDQARLIRHFQRWGMVRVPGTKFMAAAPATLCEVINPDWYPGLLEEVANDE